MGSLGVGRVLSIYMMFDGNSGECSHTYVLERPNEAQLQVRDHGLVPEIEPDTYVVILTEPDGSIYLKPIDKSQAE